MWRFYLGGIWILIQLSDCTKDVLEITQKDQNNLGTVQKSNEDIHTNSQLRNCCSSKLELSGSLPSVISVPNSEQYTSTVPQRDLNAFLNKGIISKEVLSSHQPPIDEHYHQSPPSMQNLSSDETEKVLSKSRENFLLKRVVRSDRRENPFLTSILSSLPLNNSLLMEELDNIMPKAPPQKKERALAALSGVKDDKTDNPSIEDIISDIIHLLGGNVKPSQPSPNRPIHSRINNRGPPKHYFPSHNPSRHPPSSSSSSQVFSSKFLFPDAQDVSHILGLLNTTTSTLSPSFTSDVMVTSSLSIPTPSITSPTALPLISSTLLANSTMSTSMPDSLALVSSSLALSSYGNWLPVIDPTNITINHSNVSMEEPIIITAPIAPSTFDLTVSNVIGSLTKTNLQNSTISSTSVQSKPESKLESTTHVTNIVWGKISGVTQHPAIQADVGDKHHLIDQRPINRGNGTADVVSLDIDKVRPLGKPSRGSSSHPTHLRPEIVPQNAEGLKPLKPPDRLPTRKQPYIPTQVPIVRIDTCIVGDDTTCNVEHNERCATEYGVSSCSCRPGYGRTLPRGPCAPVLQLILSFKVDRLGDRKIHFNSAYLKTETEDYKIMEHEANQAVSSLFSYTTLAGVFVGAAINNLYKSEGKVAVNATIQLDDMSLTHSRISLAIQLQRELGNAIVNRRNRVGDSKLYAERPLTATSLLGIEDINECAKTTLNDCSPYGTCYNVFGTFRCTCLPGYTDKYPHDDRTSGRICTACSADYCNKHGECIVTNGKRECRCYGNYIGSKCETDGEVLGVALGVSLAAVIVILLTVICLCLWSRRWKRDQQKCKSESDQELCSYMTGSRNGYRLTNMVDHVRWAHTGENIANTYMSTANGSSSSPTDAPVTQNHTNATREEDSNSNTNLYNRLGRQRPRITRNEVVQTANIYQDVASPVWETPYCSNHLTSNPYASGDVLKPYFS